MKFNFDLKNTAVLWAIKQEKFPLFRFAKFLKKLFFVLFVISLVLSGLYFINILSFSLETLLKINTLFLVAFLFFWEANLFLNLKIRNPETKTSLANVISEPQNYNLADFLGLEAAKIIRTAINFCEKRKIFEISSTALLYSSIKESSKIELIFLRLGVEPSSLQERIKNYLEKLERKEGVRESFSDDFQETIIEALKLAGARNHQRIKEGEILTALAKIDPFFKEILIEAELKTEDIENITLWLDYLEKKEEERKKFWSYENLSTHGSLAKDWAMGYTVTLDKFSIDWRKLVSKWFFKAIVGHEKEIEQVQNVLIKPEAGNVLLVGEPGTGRDSIIEAVARRIFLGKSFPTINYNRVVELDMVSLLSQLTTTEAVESTLDTIFQEVVTAGNVILVIKEFHNYIGIETAKPGAIDISGVIGKYLKYPQFKFIGVTDYSGLHTRIERNPSLLELLEKIEVSEISEPETMRILGNLALELEWKYKIFVTYPAMREIIKLTDRYIPNIPFPKKAIDVLEATTVYVVSLKEKIVLPQHVAKVISQKTEIPVGEVESKEKEVLLGLESLIHKKIVNQEEAVKEISTALRRARAGITSKKRPMGTFLFMGPTGVGKTETSKALAEIYFKGEERMIRLDMSEFQTLSDISRLIGGIEEEETGLLTTPVRESPFSLILLDEIEKAHPNILNLFLQVFDEGQITDGKGRKVVFTNTIIICTSNAGSEIIWKNVGAGKDLESIREELLGYFFEKGIFRPEFINRFDAVVIFKPLSKDNLLDIAGLMLESLQKNLKEKEIDFIISDELKEKIVVLSYKPEFGAREMRRVIQDKVENVIAQALLADKIKRGDKIEVRADNFELLVNPARNRISGGVNVSF